MNLLALVQEFTARMGLPRPAQVAGSTDPQVQQILALLNETLEDIVDKGWSALTQESTFSTVDGEDQGAITSLAPNGFKWILQETIFNRTLRLPLFGPIAASKWQALKALPNAGPFYKYRIVRDRLLFNPAGIAGHDCAFEYASSYCVLADDGTTYKPYPTADSDTFLFPDTVILAGLRWKRKYEKGLEYAEDFRRFEELIANAKSRDGGKPALSMDGEGCGFAPGIFVPSGNWNV